MQYVKDHPEDSEAQSLVNAMFVKGAFKGGWKGKGKGEKGTGKGDKGKGTGKGKPFPWNCFRCGEAGHRAADCPKHGGKGAVNHVADQPDMTFILTEEPPPTWRLDHTAPPQPKLVTGAHLFIADFDEHTDDNSNVDTIVDDNSFPEIGAYMKKHATNKPRVSFHNGTEDEEKEISSLVAHINETWKANRGKDTQSANKKSKN